MLVSSFCRKRFRGVPFGVADVASTSAAPTGMDEEFEDAQGQEDNAAVDVDEKPAHLRRVGSGLGRAEDCFDAVLSREESHIPWGFAWQGDPKDLGRLLIARVDSTSPAGLWAANRRDLGLEAFERGDEIIGVDDAPSLAAMVTALNGRSASVRLRVLRHQSKAPGDPEAMLKWLRSKAASRQSPSAERMSLSSPATLPAFNCVVKNTFIDLPTDDSIPGGHIGNFARSDPTPVAAASAHMQGAYTPGWFAVGAAPGSASPPCDSIASSIAQAPPGLPCPPSPAWSAICDRDGDGNEAPVVQQQQTAACNDAAIVVPAGVDEFVVGRWMSIVGLVRSPQFNGHHCFVEAFDLGMQRYTVRIRVEQPGLQIQWVTAKLRRENLVTCEGSRLEERQGFPAGAGGECAAPPIADVHGVGGVCTAPPAWAPFSEQLVQAPITELEALHHTPVAAQLLSQMMASPNKPGDLAPASPTTDLLSQKPPGYSTGVARQRRLRRKRAEARAAAAKAAELEMSDGREGQAPVAAMVELCPIELVPSTKLSDGDPIDVHVVPPSLPRHLVNADDVGPLQDAASAIAAVASAEDVKSTTMPSPNGVASAAPVAPAWRPSVRLSSP